MITCKNCNSEDVDVADEIVDVGTTRVTVTLECNGCGCNGSCDFKFEDATDVTWDVTSDNDDDEDDEDDDGDDLHEEE